MHFLQQVPSIHPIIHSDECVQGQSAAPLFSKWPALPPEPQLYHNTREHIKINDKNNNDEIKRHAFKKKND